MKSVSYKIPVCCSSQSLDCQLFTLVSQKTESASQQSIRHYFSRSSVTNFSYQARVVSLQSAVQVPVIQKIDSAIHSG